MTQKFYVDTGGRFIGSFDGSVPDDVGAVEVPNPPTDGRQIWKEGKWGEAPIPLQAITARQLRLALSKNGLLSRVEPALKAIPNDQAREEALIEWDYAIEYQPNHPLVYIMIAEFGLTDEQFRTLWLYAQSL